MAVRPPASLLRRGARTVRQEVALHPAPFLRAVGGAFVYALATVASSWVIGAVVDNVVTPRFEDGRVTSGAVLAGALAVVAVGLVKSAGIVFRRVNATIAQGRIQATLRTQVLDRYQHLPLSWHRERPTGELVAHAGSDAEAATMALAPLPWASGVCVLLTVAAGWLVLTDPFLAAVGLTLLPGLLLVNVTYQRRLEAPAALAQERVGHVSTVAHESFDGALVVKTLGAEDAETERFRVRAEALRDARIELAARTATFDALLNALPSLGVIAVLAIGAWRVEAGAISAGTLVAVAALLNLLAWPLRLVGWVLGDLPRTVAGYERVRRVLDEPVPDRPTGDVPAAHEPLDLVVDHLAFAHEEQAPTLRDVSFRVPAGATVAVVGPTGCGKSTLVALLARLLEPDTGSVRLGGHELAGLPPEALTGLVAVAFQEPFLFADTVEANIAMGAALTAAEVEAAARTAQADGFVRRLPAGYATVVGERGSTLSGGQRQRVALARALARRPRLLLLDDATSSVDPSTEADILDGLRRDLAGTTTLMVATRPSTIALADLVLYLEHGRLVATGTHAELLAATPGYAALVRAYEQARAAAAVAPDATESEVVAP